MFSIKGRLLCGVFVLLVIVNSKGYAQTDYILQRGSMHVQTCGGSFVEQRWDEGFADSMTIYNWTMSPVVLPGQQIRVRIKWGFWTSSNPVTYVNWFGDWQPNTELAQSQMYGGIPSLGYSTYIDEFYFTAPTTQKWYRIRMFWNLLYSAVPSFYGISGSGAGPNYSEFLFHVGPPTGKEEKEETPKSFSLQQNKPNPTRNRTTIQYQIPAESNVGLTIYNSAGQVVKTLINGERKRAGNYTIEWDGRDNQGKEVSPGSYFYTLDVNGKMTTKKAIIVK
jgi:hypothetical protein